MKKCLAILSIIFLVSFISSAVLAGKVYYEELKTYTDYQNEPLDINALDNIYIKSSVQVDVFPTAGKPYVEFTQTYIDLVGVTPKYDLRVEKKDKSTYIELDQTEDVMISLGVKKDEAKLEVYLPQKQIDQLNIENKNYIYMPSREQTINLQGIDIKQLVMDVFYSDISLDGKYEDVKVSTHGGSLKMKSKEPALLSTEGSMEQDLTGQFESITISGSGRYVNINSEKACDVKIRSYDSMLTLKGSYSNIDLSGDNNHIDLNSETPCKLVTDGENNITSGVGAFEIIDLNEISSQIELKTTMIPKKLQLDKAVDSTDIRLTLPANIPGLNIRYDYSKNCDFYDNDYDSEDEEEKIASDLRSITSDFELESYKSDKGEIGYSYGDKSIPIILTRGRNISLEIIEGDYNSVK